MMLLGFAQMSLDKSVPYEMVRIVTLVLKHLSVKIFA